MKKNITVEPRHDDTGKLIKLHDVLLDLDTHEIRLVIESYNQYGVHGLAAVNEIAGIHDWLDVFPEGCFHIVGNAETAYDGGPYPDELIEGK